MIRSTDVRPWFAHAVTVSLSLWLLIAVGMYARGDVFRDNSYLGEQVYIGCKWAAITCAVIAGPVTGGLAQTSLERVLGTVIGGVSGFLVYWLSTPVATRWEWALYSVTAGVFGWTAVWMGHRFSLNYSFKLAVITFLLVFAGASDLEEAKMIMVTRTLGIVAGVLLTLVLAVSVFPVSAHHQHEQHLNEALQGLLSLHALCWVPLTFVHAEEDYPTGSRRSRSLLSVGVTPGDSDGAHGAFLDYVPMPRPQPPAPPPPSDSGGMNTGFVKRNEFAGVAYGVDRLKVGEDDEVKGAEETVVEVYTALHKADAALPLLDREIYVGLVRDSPFYLPRFLATAVGLGGCRRMPTAAARSAAAAARGVARVQLSLHNLLRDGVDGIVKDILAERYPAALVPDIVKLARSAIQDCMEAMARGQLVCEVSMQHLRTAVATLIAISGTHRSRVHAQYCLYRDTARDLRHRLHHHASVVTSRRRSTSGGRCCPGGSAAGGGAGGNSSCVASAAAWSGQEAGSRGPLARLLGALSITRKPQDSTPTDGERSDCDDATASLLRVRTSCNRAPSTGSHDLATPGSHDCGATSQHVSSPFSALHRDSTSDFSPAAIRLSFAVHRDGDMLNAPHHSHPAVKSLPQWHDSGSCSGADPSLPSVDHPSHGQGQGDISGAGLAPIGSAMLPADFLSASLGSSIKGSSDQTTGRAVASPLSGDLGDNRSLSLPSNAASDAAVTPIEEAPTEASEHSGCGSASQSPVRGRHSRSRSHNTHDILSSVHDMRAILVHELSSPRVQSPHTRSRPGSPSLGPPSPSVHSPPRSSLPYSCAGPHATRPHHLSPSRFTHTTSPSLLCSCAEDARAPSPADAAAPSPLCRESCAAPAAPNRLRRGSVSNCQESSTALPSANASPGSVPDPPAHVATGTSAKGHLNDCKAGFRCDVNAPEDGETHLLQPQPAPQEGTHAGEALGSSPSMRRSSARKIPQSGLSTLGRGSGKDWPMLTGSCGKVAVAPAAAAADSSSGPFAAAGGTPHAGRSPPMDSANPHAGIGQTVFLSMSPASARLPSASAGRRLGSDGGQGFAEERPSDARRSCSGAGGGSHASLGSRSLTLGDPQSLLIFPDTPEGHYAQITYYAFQFQLEELVEALEELQAAFATLIRVTPRHCRSAACRSPQSHVPSSAMR